MYYAFDAPCCVYDNIYTYKGHESLFVINTRLLTYIYTPFSFSPIKARLIIYNNKYLSAHTIYARNKFSDNELLTPKNDNTVYI